MSLTISRNVKNVPRLPYEKIFEAILGRTYELSLTFIGEKRARTLNVRYRGAEYIPNVLSFPLTEKVGEVYITPKVAEKEAKRHNFSTSGYLGYLFIHGLLHLKGYPHGATMEKAEKRYMKRFDLQ